MNATGVEEVGRVSQRWETSCPEAEMPRRGACLPWVSPRQILTYICLPAASLGGACGVGGDCTLLPSSSEMFIALAALDYHGLGH